MALIDKIIKITISRQGGSVISKEFSTILLIGNTNPDEDSVVEYNSASQVLNTFGDGSPEYKAAVAIFSQSPSVDKIYIIQCSEAPGNYLSAYNKAKDEKYFYAVGLLGLIPGTHDVDVGNVAYQVEADKKLLSLSIKNNTSDLELLANLKNANLMRTFAMFTNSPSVENYANLAWLGKLLPKPPGSASWSHKELSGVASDNLSDYLINELDSLNCNYYTIAGSKGDTYPGLTLNKSWIDEVYSLDWLEDALKSNVLNLFQSNDIIPYTEKGTSLIKSVVEKCLAQALNNGVISKYLVTNTNILNVPEVDIADRNYKGLFWSARLTGAINKVNIPGVVSNAEISGVII